MYKKIKEKFSKNNTKIVEVKKDFDFENSFEVSDFNLWYKNGSKQALFDININLKKNRITSLIGPSGCGKSSFLRSLNSMYDLLEGIKQEGSIFFESKNIQVKNSEITRIRTEIGMVFQKPTPFPISIFENVAYGPRSHGIRDKKALTELVEKALKDVALWEEVKNNLDDSGESLSGGQQQRLCIARAIALEPKVLLMDEPTSALDPIATSKIEELILKLKKKYTIIIVTHSMAQAQRISNETVFFYEGKIVEKGRTKKIFMNPVEKKTKDYINGKIG